MTIGHDCKPVRNAARFFRERLSTCRSSEPDTRCEFQPRPPLGGSWLLTNDGRGNSRSGKLGSIQLGSSIFLIVRDAQIVEVEIYFGWSIPHEAKGFEKLTERFGQVMNSKGERDKFTASSFPHLAQGSEYEAILGTDASCCSKMVEIGAEGGSRTRTSFRTTDFKSA